MHLALGPEFLWLPGPGESSWRYLPLESGKRISTGEQWGEEPARVFMADRPSLPQNSTAMLLQPPETSRCQSRLKSCRVRSPPLWGCSGHAGSLSQRGESLVLKAEGQGQWDMPGSAVWVWRPYRAAEWSCPGGHAAAEALPLSLVPSHSCRM